MWGGAVLRRRPPEVGELRCIELLETEHVRRLSVLVRDPNAVKLAEPYRDLMERAERPGYVKLI